MRNPEQRTRRTDPDSERFADSIKEIVRRLQRNKSIITGEPITEFHHLKGKGKNCNQVGNCVGVGVVAHALIHFWQWEVSGLEDEWNAYQGQCHYFTESQRRMFRELKSDEDKSKKWKDDFVDPVEIMVRGKTNVHYI